MIQLFKYIRRNEYADQVFRQVYFKCARCKRDWEIGLSIPLVGDLYCPKCFRILRNGYIPIWCGLGKDRCRGVFVDMSAFSRLDLVYREIYQIAPRGYWQIKAYLPGKHRDRFVESYDLDSDFFWELGLGRVMDLFL